jgi:hypothetical protein
LTSAADHSWRERNFKAIGGDSAGANLVAIARSGLSLQPHFRGGPEQIGGAMAEFKLDINSPNLDYCVILRLHNPF